MSDGQHNSEVVKSSFFSNVLLGKIASHKAFSDTTLFRMLIAFAFLLPLFFIPGSLVAPEFAKMIFLEILVFVAIIMWMIGRYKDGHIVVPKSSLLFVLALLLVQFVVSGIFSPTPSVSFIGSGYDIGTVNSFVVLFLLMYLASSIFTNRDRVLTLYAALSLSTLIAMVYHLLRHFLGADFLDFGIFTSPVLSPIGKWNDMVSLFGGVSLLALTTLYFFPNNRTIKIPAYLILITSMFFLLLVDFTILWIILAVLIGLIVSFAIYDGEQTHKLLAQKTRDEGGEHVSRPFSKRLVGHLPPFAVFFLAIALIYGSGLSGKFWGETQKNISSIVGDALNATPYSEVMLTTGSTYDILSKSLGESPVLGTGPNRFSSSYLKFKSTDINRTPYWDSAFDFGLGRIPTYFGTTGILGMLLWVAFIVLLFAKARHVFSLFSRDRIAAYLSFSLFLLAIYFWSLAFFYLPNITIFALAFLFTGVLVAFLVSENVLKTYTVSLVRGGKGSNVVTPILVILLIGIFASSYLLYRQISSLVAFRDAEIAMNNNDIDQAEAKVRQAISMSERDIYYRSLSNIGIIRLRSLTTSTLEKEQVASLVNEYVVLARGSAERAIELNNTNFENYLQLGGVFDSFSALGQDSSALAKVNYESALQLNPKSPRILFMLARIELLSGNRPNAKTLFYRALSERPNLPEAMSVLIQLEVEDGNTDNALKILENGLSIEPTNFLFHFAHGYLNFTAAKYEEAQRSFEFAAFLNPDYADAKYFLGLSYARRNLTQQAIVQFKEVQVLNPDNKELAAIIKALESGRDIFRAGLIQGTQPDTTLGGATNGGADN